MLKVNEHPSDVRSLSPSGSFVEQACFTSQAAMRAGILILLPCSAAFSGLAGVPAPRLRRASSPLLQDVTRPARGDRGTADGQVVAVLTRARGRPYCTYGLRGPAFCLPHVPEAQGSLPPGPHALYVRRTRASLGRAARTRTVWCTTGRGRASAECGAATPTPTPTPTHHPTPHPNQVVDGPVLSVEQLMAERPGPNVQVREAERPG